MIAVDTSVWVAALRDRNSREARLLEPLLDVDDVLMPIPVKIELLSGASSRNREALARGLEALPIAYPTDDTWRMLVTWTEKTSAAGLSFGVGDLLIAAIAHEQGALVWSLDSAFDRMSQLKLVGVHAP